MSRSIALQLIPDDARTSIANTLREIDKTVNRISAIQDKELKPHTQKIFDTLHALPKTWRLTSNTAAASGIFDDLDEALTSIGASWASVHWHTAWYGVATVGRHSFHIRAMYQGYSLSILFQYLTEG